MENKSNAFSSIMGFLFTAIGFAVGVGSIWRFPYVLGDNGGALFLIAYVAIILIIGIPLLTAEISIGFESQRTAVLAYKTLAPGRPWHFAGYAHLVAAILIISYTMPIYAWILNYFCKTITGGFRGMNALAVTEYFEKFSGNIKLVAVFAAVNIGINALIISGGVRKGIELVTKILLPALGIIMVVLIIAGLRMPGASDGVTFLLKPDPSKFTINSLSIALGQAFFAVGIGMLASMVFGSYIKNKGENIGKSAMVICTALICAGLLAGFTIFPALFASGLAPESGVGLTFIVLPNVFNFMKGGVFFGTLFYLAFYIAAVTSSAGVMEAVVGLLMDQFEMTRKKALVITVIFMAVIGGVCLPAGRVFSILDLLENNYLLTLGALAISIFTGWVWGIDKFIKASNVKGRLAQSWLKVTIKYISPIVIIAIFIMGFF